jgi:excisionase family DNA binding protein
MVQRRLDPAEQHRGERRAVRDGHESAVAPRLPQPRRRAETSEGRPADGVVAYDVAEVLRRLGVTRPTIYRFLNSGELRSFRLGTRRLVSADALADFIRAREDAESG